MPTMDHSVLYLRYIHVRPAGPLRSALNAERRIYVSRRTDDGRRVWHLLSAAPRAVDLCSILPGVIESPWRFSHRRHNIHVLSDSPFDDLQYVP